MCHMSAVSGATLKVFPQKKWQHSDLQQARFSLAILLASIALHVYLAPYSKVEESFNIQAVHDFLVHGENVEAYDHNEFPGVVPRSFIGSAALAVASAPLVYTSALLHISKWWGQLIVRGVLGVFSWLCIVRLSNAVASAFGVPTAAFFGLLSCFQFHIPFYASRTLPNVFAFGPVVLALAHYLDGSELWLTPVLMAATAVIMRCDMVLLAGTVCLSLAFTRRMRFWSLVLWGILSATLALATTVAFDSLLWGRLLWPEGEVLWFNTVLNKSKEWGVMPAHWYISSALPRGLLATLPLSLLGVSLEPRIRPLAASVATFIALYSCLGHKEIRFLFPVLPAFTVAAACGMERLWKRRQKSVVHKATCWCALAAVAASGTAVVAFTQASVANYPGGEALAWLHNYAASGQAKPGRELQDSVAVHMDTAACMTGISRFGQISPRWQYFKNESLLESDFQQAMFDYLISARPTVPGYERLHSVESFSGMTIRKYEGGLQFAWPLVVLLEPKMYVHQFNVPIPSSEDGRPQEHETVHAEDNADV